MMIFGGQKRQVGFTLVELLIVIVVIAILAAITLVTYSGIQDRAKNSSRISAARNTLTLVNLYYTDNQGYPELPVASSSGVRAACLGDGWPVRNGQPVCWNVYAEGEAFGASTFLQDDNVNSELSEFGSLPDYPTDPAGTIKDSNNRSVDVGALILYYRENNTSTFKIGYSLAYVLKGNYQSTDCGLPGASASDISGTLTRCVVSLPS